MNSMFSSFDALCAEFLGHTIRSSFASATTVNHSLMMKKPDQGNSSPPSAPAGVEKQHQPPQKKAPRFAPELDGLNCFETLVKL